MKHAMTSLQTATATTTLATGAVGGNGRHIFNAADTHTSTGQRAQSRLGTRARRLGSGTASGAQLDVQRSDADFLAADGNILSGQHGSVGRRFVTIRLDLHAACA
jgi:hypothetical protein